MTLRGVPPHRAAAALPPARVRALAGPHASGSAKRAGDGAVAWGAVARPPRPLAGRGAPLAASASSAAPNVRASAADEPETVTALVVARGLVKRFGTFTAVDGVDFEIARGECFGFLGPNGAGKTSTMRMISCMSPPSGGVLRVLGMDPASAGPRIRARLGLVPQEDSLDLELTVLDNLIVYARYFDIPKPEARRRAAELLEFAQLAERANDKVEPLSGGMKRRLTIARALVSRPDLLILDEPTTGLDPQARHLLWDRLFRLKQDGVSQIVTTHYMEEAEQLCDRLVIMDHGRFAAEGSPRDLIQRFSTRDVVELRFADPADQARALELGPLAERVEVLPDRLLLYTDDGDALLGESHRRGHSPVSGLVRRSTLEDVFLRLTGRSLID
jgi:lipooligosaccharide transport system ATP-binding protein